MTVFVANVGTGLLLVDAVDEDHCRAALVKRLGYGHKPWIAARIEIKVDEEAEALLMAHGAKVWKAPAPKVTTKGKIR